MKLALEIEATPSSTITIQELSRRDAANLRTRGGQKCSDLATTRLESMLKRWPRYREHAELQLINFYEENPTKVLHTPYIGCNKLSCFLCFNFIVQHGRLHVSGCHQSLYSLWTVRNVINFESDAAATKYRQSLAYVSEALEEMVMALRSQTWISGGGGTGKESVANLSRISLAFSDDAATVMSVIRGTGIDATLDDDEQVQRPSSGLVTVVEEDEVSLRSYQSPYTAGVPMLERDVIAHDREMPNASCHQSSSEKKTAHELAHIDTARKYSVQTWQTSYHQGEPQKHRRRKHRRQGHQKLDGFSVYRHRRTSKQYERKKAHHRSRHQEDVRHRGSSGAAVMLRKLARFVKKVLFGSNTTVREHQQFA